MPYHVMHQAMPIQNTPDYGLPWREYENLTGYCNIPIANFETWQRAADYIESLTGQRLVDSTDKVQICAFGRRDVWFLDN